jgi:hypothetical protein
MDVVRRVSPILLLTRKCQRLMELRSRAHVEDLAERLALDAPDYFRGCVGLQDRRAEVVVEIPGNRVGGGGDLGDRLTSEPDVLVFDSRWCRQ